MDRVRDYLDGLKIQDPRHALSKQPIVIPLDWNRSKLRPLLTTSDNLYPEGKALLGNAGALQLGAGSDVAMPAELRAQDISDKYSGPKSRSSSSRSSYSSCFSEAGRSASTVSSRDASYTRENRSRAGFKDEGPLDVHKVKVSYPESGNPSGVPDPSLGKVLKSEGSPTNFGTKISYQISSDPFDRLGSFQPRPTAFERNSLWRLERNHFEPKLPRECQQPPFSDRRDSSSSSESLPDSVSHRHEPPVRVKQPYRRHKFSKYPQETLHEEHIVCKEDRNVLITKPNPRRASLDMREAVVERNSLVYDDLQKEQREFRREKRRKWKSDEMQRRAAAEAKIALIEKEEVDNCELKPCQEPGGATSSEEESYFHTNHSQVSQDNISRSILPNSNKLTLNEIVDSQCTDKGHTSCHNHPPISSAEGRHTEHEIECASQTYDYSQMSSQTDATSSQDDTDWEEDSDDGNLSSLARRFASRGVDNELDLESSIVQHQMTPLKTKMVDRLMVEFWTLFNQTWSTGNRQCGLTSDAGSQSTSTVTSETSTSRNSSITRHAKRSRFNSGEDEEKDDRSGRRRRRPDKLPVVDEDDALQGQFACPFRKRNPHKYSVQDWPRCSLRPQQTIARLKAHLYKYHLIQQCIRCKAVFESETELESHIMTEERCDVKVGELADGMTRRMKDEIQCRKRTHPGQTEAEKWERIYNILFPNEPVPDPFFESILDHGILRTQSPDSVNLAEYEEYLRRVLPNFVRNALEAAVSNELQPIQAQLHGRITEIIQDAYNSAFSSFRDMRRSESRIRSPSESDTDINLASPTHNAGNIEMYFQPPPAANDPVSFFNLSQLRALHQTTAQNNPSDSGYASRLSISSSSHRVSLDGAEVSAPLLSGTNSSTGRGTNPHIVMDSLELNQTQDSYSGPLNGSYASDLNTTLQNFPNIQAAGPCAPALTNETSNHNYQSADPEIMSENSYIDEPWDPYSVNNSLDMNYFDGDTEQEFGKI